MGTGLTPLTLRTPAASNAGPLCVWTRSERASEPSPIAASGMAGWSAARPVSTMEVMAAQEGATRHAAASAETAKDECFMVGGEKLLGGWQTRRGGVNANVILIWRA